MAHEAVLKLSSYIVIRGPESFASLANRIVTRSLRLDLGSHRPPRLEIRAPRFGSDIGLRRLARRR